MILDIFKDSLEYSFKDEKIILKLGILSLLSFLIFPVFMFLGYNYRVIKTATLGMINGDDELPVFDDFISMFIDGIKVYLIKMIYMIIPFIVFIIIIMMADIVDPNLGFISTVIVTLGIFLTIIITAICYLFSLIAIPKMAFNNDSINSAFDIKEIYNSLKAIGIIKFISFVIGIIIISAVIFTVISIIFAFIGGLGLIVTSYIYLPATESILAVLVMIYFLVLIFVGPILQIFENRAIGLIYEEGEVFE